MSQEPTGLVHFSGADLCEAAHAITCYKIHCEAQILEWQNIEAESPFTADVGAHVAYWKKQRAKAQALIAKIEAQLKRE